MFPVYQKALILPQGESDGYLINNKGFILEFTFNFLFLINFMFWLFCFLFFICVFNSFD